MSAGVASGRLARLMPGRWQRIGVVILAVMAVVAVAAPLLAPYAPDARVGMPFSAPSPAHPLGTNDVGHDLLTHLIHGARTSLLVGTVAAGVATVIGTLVGLVAGFLGGWVDTVLMRLVDVVLSLPFLPLMIVVAAFVGAGLTTEIAVIAAVMWAGAARELRSQVLSLRERDHVRAAVAMGGSAPYVIGRHLLPGVAPLVVPQFVLAAKRAVLFEAALSFLGLGPAGRVSWGIMLFHAQRRSAFLTDAWLWWVVPPGLAIALTVVGFALVGYGLETPGRGEPGARRHRGRPHLPDVRGEGAATGPDPGEGALLAVEDLAVDYGRGAERVTALRGVGLRIAGGDRVGLVGASGSGKSTLALAAVGLLHSPGHITRGRVRVDGRDLAALSPRRLRRLRGDRVAFVPQEATSALNPVVRVGDQVTEAVRLHRSVPRRAARRRAVGLLEQVGLGADVAAAHPHQLSGGMRQRAVLAVAFANDPDLLIVDEPTTGLDVVTQVELIDLLAELQAHHGTALLTVSHDLAVVAALSDRLAVMRGGRIVETGPCGQVLSAPSHAHTRRLVDSLSRLQVDPPGPQETGR